METILVALISGLSVAVPNIIATLVTNRKEKTQKMLNDVKDSIKKELESIKKSLKEETLSRCKTDLINAMSKIQNGYTPTEEERRILIEEKEQYNHLGGDSYVDDMFERLKKEGKL